MLYFAEIAELEMRYGVRVQRTIHQGGIVLRFMNQTSHPKSGHAARIGIYSIFSNFTFFALIITDLPMEVMCITK